MKKNWVEISVVLINIISILLLIDLASFDSMENHLTNGGVIFSRPINYSVFCIISIIISTLLIFEKINKNVKNS